MVYWTHDPEKLWSAVTDSIKLLIVDDHPLFRQGLVDVLETDPRIQVIAAAANGETALELARANKPEIVIMDVNLPQGNGLQITRQMLSDLPRTKVIILTGYDNPEQVYHSLQIGAVAYRAKDIPPDDLLKTIFTVREGRYVIHDQVLSHEEVLEWIKQRAGRYVNAHNGVLGGSSSSLSPREMEILELVTDGISNKDIAQRLGISQQTVKNHVTTILRKLQVDDRTQAAIFALRQGWVRLDGS
jgi:RNA polymerase sigma factor (sigma-70 family)